jgi:hypothetical protein
MKRHAKLSLLLLVAVIPGLLPSSVIVGDRTMAQAGVPRSCSRSTRRGVLRPPGREVCVRSTLPGNHHSVLCTLQRSRERHRPGW